MTQTAKERAITRKRYYELHREEILLYQQEKRNIKKEERKKLEAEYYERHKEEIEKDKKEKVERQIEHKKLYRAARRDEVSALRKERIATDPEYLENLNRQRREWKKNNKDKVKNGRLKLRYGITQVEYDSMYRSQMGRCAICGISGEDLSSNLVVDHDHETNKIRGLLCLCCNSLLGYSKDNPRILMSAISYLQGLS